jgi:C-terminal processing protease CtpA/Prc
MQSTAYREGNIYQKDFLLFTELLWTTHPAFAPGQKAPFNMDSLKTAGYQHLKSCDTITELKRFLLTILAPLHDGHTFSTMPFQNNMQLLYPMKIFVENHIPYVLGIEKKHKRALGKQITAINELSIADVYHEFKKIIIAENDFFFEDQVFEWILFPEIWHYILRDRKNDSLLQLTFQDGTHVNIEARKRSDINFNEDLEFVISDNTHPIITHHQNVPFFYTILEYNKIAYLQFNQCVDQNAVRHYYHTLGKSDENGVFPFETESQLQQYPKFDTLLYSMFNEIKNRNVATLVVDIRNNSGGNSMLCKQLFAYLADANHQFKTMNSATRISDFFIQYYPEFYDELCKKAGYKLDIGQLYYDRDFPETENDSSPKDISSKYFQINSDTSLIFKRNIVFIQGKSTYSSAGILLVEAKDNHIGTIIGENSTYRPCNYGDILFWKLPNTEISGGISHKYFARPDESKCGEDFLAPDIYIPKTMEDYKNGTDSCYEWITSVYLQK